MKKKGLKKIFFALIFLFLILGASFVSAQEVNYPRIPGVLAPQDFPDDAQPGLYVKYIISLAMWAAGVVALAALIYGGILYLMSSGKPDRMVAAKEQIVGAFLGVLILFSIYFILQTINPSLRNLTVPDLEPTELEGIDRVFPILSRTDSSVDVELPLGRIIEKIFETYISEYPTPEETWIPSMTRIINRVNATQQVIDPILEYSTTLEDLADECTCRDTEADPDCPWAGCASDCFPRPLACTCDPCEDVRDEIVEHEELNLEQIYGDITVSGMINIDGEFEEIETNLMQELAAIEEEARLLKDWVQRLRRAKKLISECPLVSLNTWTQLAFKKNKLEELGGVLRTVNFWDDMSIHYYPGQRMESESGRLVLPVNYIETDVAAFYCRVGGSLEQPISHPTEPDLSGDESEEEVEDILSREMACSNEIPIGEIIDRAERTGQLLIDRLDRIAYLNRRLTNSVNSLHVQISQCSSKACIRVCIPICLWWINFCIPLGCMGDPCRFGDINGVYANIRQIHQEMTNLIHGTLIDEERPNDSPENIGVMALIDEVAPVIIKDLRRIRYTMLHYDNVFNCIQAKGAAIPPNQEPLQICCPTPSLGEDGQTAYIGCLTECHVERDWDDYRACLQGCLIRRGDELPNEDLEYCIPELNFYVCQ
jgi:hypothetical protein